mgnify:CR=1 FL=1
MNGYPRFGWVDILRFQQSDTMVPIHALQWYRFADTVTRIAISVEVRRGYIVFRRIFRIVSVVSAGASVVVSVVSAGVSVVVSVVVKGVSVVVSVVVKGVSVVIVELSVVSLMFLSSLCKLRFCQDYYFLGVV